MSGLYIGSQTARLYLGETPIGGEAVLIPKTITANGTYNASSDSANGYSSVQVAVEPPEWVYDDSVFLWLVNDIGMTQIPYYKNQQYVLPLPFTLEVCAKVDAAHTTNGRLVELYKSNHFTSIAVNGTRDKELEICIDYQWFSDIGYKWGSDETHTISIVVDSALSKLYIDGAYYAGYTPTISSNLTVDSVYNRCGSTQSRGLLGENYCVRGYGRALTAAEIAANYAVDADKFGGD